MSVDKNGTRTNGVNSGSRAANFNNSPANSNWNISVRAVSDDKFHPRQQAKACGVDPAVLWSATSSRYGEYISGSRERRVAKYRKTDLHSCVQKNG
jgi:hypothetical protein